MFKIIAKSGTKRGLSWSLGEEPITVGRDPDCEIRLGEYVVSRRHCQFLLQDERVWLHDLNSLNPPAVNGREISEPTKLEEGDEVRVGYSTFCVARERPAGNERNDKVEFHSTILLAEDDASYAHLEGDEPGGQTAARALGDLSALLLLSSALGRTNLEQSMRDTLQHTLHERFESSASWFTELLPNDDRVTTPLGSKQRARPGADVEAVVSRAMAQRLGALSQYQLRRSDGTIEERSALCASLVLGDRIVGAITLIAATRERVYTKEDLRFLKAVTNIFAPLWHAAKHVKDLETENLLLREEVAHCAPYVGESAMAQQVRERVVLLGPSDQPVIIEGETGTGKELVATMLHQVSRRAGKAIVRVNCAAIPEHLFEAQFFGHEKGAFTGADRERRGLFEQAHEGTLFLDEIGDLNLDNQARILRALEEGTFRRIGDLDERKVDFRLIVATNQSMASLLKAGRFREDLYYRLKGSRITLNPLRERPEDILPLAEYHLHLASRRLMKVPPVLSMTIKERLLSMPWNGNVRELKQFVTLLATLAEGEEVDLDRFESIYEGFADEDLEEGPLKLAEVERRHIARVLRLCQNNVVRAAELLGVSKSKLYSRLEEYEVGD